ncbi:hypothetical protein [Paracandidimonas soli]|uniref:Uncharacterized protein n=1 Tax=Paracandidimonas soli TaxID=1917182 RepID=A0A4R3UT77_9BURK|nr:hypothetical protein [Paracandidimonas soli]TCU93927.1 hypothetical protein EV686_11095 [Paracandidimonas soli]
MTMTVHTFANTILACGLTALVAIAAASWLARRKDRRKSRPAHTITGYRQPVSGYAPGSDKPSCGWPCAWLMVIAVVALAVAFTHVAVAAGF